MRFDEDRVPGEWYDYADKITDERASSPDWWLKRFKVFIHHGIANWEIEVSLLSSCMNYTTDCLWDTGHEHELSYILEDAAYHMSRYWDDHTEDK